MIVTIRIPLPPRTVKPHNSGHWSTKSQAVKQYRLIARLAAQSQAKGIKLCRKVVIDHTWFLGLNQFEKAAGAKCPKTYMAYRPQDEGNAIQALKPAIDGLVDSGLLIDDRAAFVKWGEYTRNALQKDHNGRSEIVLRLVEVLG